MRGEGPDQDEIDAVVGDEIHNGDLAATAALVHDLRSAYLTDRPLVRSTGLMAAMDSSRATAGITPRAGTASTRKNRKVLTKISALAAGVTGKIVLGAAVTAAAAGGLTAADVIEVPNRGDAAQNDPPGLAVAADRAPEAADKSPDDTTSTTASEPESQTTAEAVSNEDGQATAEAAREKVDAADAFTAAIDEWVGCVSEAAAAHPEGEGRFDPAEACGERPHSSEFGLTTPPSQNHDANPSEMNPSETNPSENARNESDSHGKPDKPESAGGSGPESNPATADDSTPAADRPGNGPPARDQSRGN